MRSDSAAGRRGCYIRAVTSRHPFELLLISLVLAASGCRSTAAEEEPPELVIGTWNLHNFSGYGTNEWRIAGVSETIGSLGVDLLAVQELKVEEGTEGEPPQAWDRLLDRLDELDGLHNPWNPDDTTVGLIYRPEVVTVLASQQLFPDDQWAFPRPPLEVRVEVNRDGRSVELSLIVLHLKAFGDSLDRRRAACNRLESHLEDRGGRYIILGDLNDDPYDPPAENAFSESFLAPDSDWHFVTAALPPESVTSQGYYHMVGDERITGELIDHLIVGEELFDEYDAWTPRIEGVPEEEFSHYEDLYSDHFPVIVTATP